MNDNIPSWQKPYIRKTKCNCRVCLVTRYIKHRKGDAAADAWLDEGMSLEYKIYKATKRHDMHFDKKLIDERYSE